MDARAESAAESGAPDASGSSSPGESAQPSSPPARASESAVLTIDEAARLLRVNRKTLYDAVKAGQVPGVVRLGRAIRIGRTALLRWVEGNGRPALGDHR